MLFTRTCLASVVLATSALIAFTTAEADAADGHRLTSRRVNTLRDVSASTPCQDRLAISPVVMMTSSGGTLLGPSLSTITIFSNGLVTVSSATGFNGASSAGQALVDPQFVKTLRADLRAVGAHTACDQQYDVYDAPLKTVTFFRGGQDARAHTFSYWIPEAQFEVVDNAILGFLAEHVLND